MSCNNCSCEPVVPKRSRKDRLLDMLNGFSLGIWTVSAVMSNNPVLWGLTVAVIAVNIHTVIRETR